MNLFAKLSVATIFFLPLNAGWAGTQEEAKVVEQPPVKTTEPWEIKVAAPGMLANVSGFTGFHGINPYVSVGVGQLLKHVNFVYSFGAEVRRGRIGILGDLLYLDGQAGVSGTGLVERVGLGMQQFLGEFFGSYRVIEGASRLVGSAGRVWMHLSRATDRLKCECAGNDVASTQLVNQFAQQLTRTPHSDLRTLIISGLVSASLALARPAVGRASCEPMCSSLQQV